MGDPRAGQVLATAHANVLAQAVLTSDPALRKSFLHNISEHREIVAAWTAHETAAAGSVAMRRSRASRNGIRPR
jgi:hypothetical protein